MAHMAGTGRILCSLEGPLISQYSRGTPQENCKQILITHEEFSLLDVEVGATSQRHLAPCLAQSRHSINAYGWMNKLTWLERMCGFQSHCGSENTGTELRYVVSGDISSRLVTSWQCFLDYCLSSWSWHIAAFWGMVVANFPFCDCVHPEDPRIILRLQFPKTKQNKKQ